MNASAIVLNNSGNNHFGHATMISGIVISMIVLPALILLWKSAERARELRMLPDVVVFELVVKLIFLH